MNINKKRLGIIGVTSIIFVVSISVFIFTQIGPYNKNNTKGIFNVCLNYGGQQEIVDGAKRLAEDYKNGLISLDDIDEKYFYKYMYNELPPIDLMIRTSGELRISNFLMYELSYAELYFTETCFPDFNEEAFETAVDDFNTRERRFSYQCQS